MKSSKTPARKGGQTRNAPAKVSRRAFLNLLWTVLGLAAVAEFVWMALSFLWPAKSGRRENRADTIVTAGALSAFEPGSVTAFQRGEFYLVRLDDGGFLALSCKCTHLGCTVPWVEKERQFLCPCHASAFDITGNVISSPAARALDTFAVWIENDRVKVDTGSRFKRSGLHPGRPAYPPKA